MILDSSAIVAQLFEESTHEQLRNCVDRAARVAVGSPTLVETGLVLSSRYGSSARRLLIEYCETIGAEVIAFERRHAAAALDAFLRFGKGRHPARLNYGDCMTYAVAKLAGEPLLCVGEDFAKTDLELAG